MTIPIPENMFNIIQAITEDLLLVESVAMAILILNFARATPPDPQVTMVTSLRLAGLAALSTL